MSTRTPSLIDILPDDVFFNEIVSGLDYKQVNAYCDDPEYAKNCDARFYLSRIAKVFKDLPVSPVGGMTPKEYHLLLHSLHDVDYGSEAYIDIKLCINKAIAKGDDRLVKYFCDIGRIYGQVFDDYYLNGYYLDNSKYPYAGKYAIAALESGILTYKDVSITYGKPEYIVAAKGYITETHSGEYILVALACGGGVRQALLFQRSFRRELGGVVTQQEHIDKIAIIYGLALRGNFEEYKEMADKNLIVSDIPILIKTMSKFGVSPINLDIINYILDLTHEAILFANLLEFIMTHLGGFGTQYRMANPDYARTAEQTFKYLANKYPTNFILYSSYNTMEQIYFLDVLDLVRSRKIKPDLAKEMIFNTTNPIVLARNLVERGYITYKELLNYNPVQEQPYTIAFRKWLSVLTNTPIDNYVDIDYYIRPQIVTHENITYTRVRFTTIDARVQDLIEMVLKELVLDDNSEIVAYSDWSGDYEPLDMYMTLRSGMKIDLVIEHIQPLRGKFKPGGDLLIYKAVVVNVNDKYIDANIVEASDKVVVHYANRDVVVDRKDVYTYPALI